MEKFFRNNQKLIFWIISAILAVIILSFLYFSLTFLLAKSGDIFGDSLIKEKEVVKFKLDQIERIK